MTRGTRVRRIAAVLAAIPMLLSLAQDPAYAYSRTKRYEIAGTGIQRHEKDRACSVRSCVTKDRSIDVGGVEFPPIRGGTTPTTVSVTARDDHRDVVGLVRLTACQNLNGDSTCGGAGEPTVSGCVKPNQYLRLAGVKRTKPILVFVYAMWGCPRYLIPDVLDRQGGGSTGTVKIVWY